MQTLSNMDRTETLYITGPAGLTEELVPILKLARRLCYELVPIDIPADGLILSEIIRGWSTEAKLSAFATEHCVPSQGYCFNLGRVGKFMPERAQELGVPMNQWGLLQKGQRLQIGDKTIFPEQVLGEPRKGLKFVFTGDTAFCENLITAAKNADLLICESTYGEKEQAPHAIEHGRHMTLAQAAEVAAKAEVKQLWLAHYSQMLTYPRQYLPNATSIFENTVCGYDGLSTTLRFE